MALTPAITVSQNSGLPNVINITDSSTGNDPGLTSRRVYLYQSNNDNLVPDGTTTDYIEWDISDSTIAIDVLERDMALMIVVQWLTGAVVTYTYDNTYAFPAYTNTFLYNLSVTDQLSNPDIVKDTTYLFNKLQLFTYVKDAENAISEGGDTVKAQLAFDLAYQMMTNQQLYF